MLGTEDTALSMTDGVISQEDVEVSQFLLFEVICSTESLQTPSWQVPEQDLGDMQGQVPMSLCS